jgi:hypothetical protein
MYPVEALQQGVYTVDDLPDEISTGKGIFIKGQGPSAGIDIQPPGAVYAAEGYPGDDGEEDYVYSDPGSGQWSGGPGMGSGTQECLIGIEYGDLFADTYIISGPISGAVTRESICVWRGSNLRLTNFGFQWKVNGNNKSGFQNTPVGSYAGGFTVS